MCHKISTDVIDYINLERFRELLRKHDLQVSGLKTELVDRIQGAVNGASKTLTLKVLEDFLAEEICHGKNRMLFISSFDSNMRQNVKKIETIRSNMKSHGFESNDFNNLRVLSKPEKTTLCYFRAYEKDSKEVYKISFCFARTSIIEGRFDEEGEELPPRSEMDYTWVEIDPEDCTIIIKVKPKNGSFENVAKTKAIYEEISTRIREIFCLPPRSMELVKNTLYKIFNDLTNTAEEPFKERVQPLKDEISECADKWAEKMGLPSSIDPVDLPSRLTRLLERALIQQEFDEYKKYFYGKKGIVERICFFDLTGAHVNTRSEDGMALADIYFDTRDTIDGLQQLDKLWVTWFFNNHKNNTDEIKTKFEVFKEHFIIHFLYTYTTREVENHVLSSFKNYGLLQ